MTGCIDDIARASRNTAVGAIERLPGLSAPEDLRIHRLDAVERGRDVRERASPDRCRARRATTRRVAPHCVRPIARAMSTCRSRRARRSRRPNPPASRSGARRARARHDRRSAPPVGAVSNRRARSRRHPTASGGRRRDPATPPPRSGEAIGVLPVRRTADRSPACARWPRCARTRRASGRSRSPASSPCAATRATARRSRGS